MKVQDFLAQHGVGKNPFSEEDAQTDPVFKQHCIESTYHPAWDKIFGDPSDPATSIVFGEKGAGKTAMRLQISKHLEEFNRKNPNKRLFVIKYDDFNPFLDRFVSHLPVRRRRIDKALASWRLWDHMDAILSIGVTDLNNQIIGKGTNDGSEIPADRLAELDAHQRRDLLLLSTFYDQSNAQPFRFRWSQLRRKLRIFPFKAHIPLGLGLIVSLGTLITAMTLFFSSTRTDASDSVVELWNQTPWWAYFLVAGVAWMPWMWKFVTRWLIAKGATSSNQVSDRSISQIRKVLMQFTNNEISGQPFPNKDRTDDRYELLDKFQSILKTLGFDGVFVLVDRVDEPHLINGSPELMKALIWPLLDNKFLKHQGIGVKLMLPAELKYYVEREDRDFAQRARLDKQNLVPSLAWTGEALFDMANSRLQACATNGKPVSISSFFNEAISHSQLIDSFRSLRVPRHLHKFLYHLLVAHCNSHTDQDPSWKVSKEMFETELAMYRRDLEAQS